MTKFTRMLGTFGFKSDEPNKRGQIIRTLPRGDDKLLPRNQVYVVWDSEEVQGFHDLSYHEGNDSVYIEVELCELI